MSSQSPILLLKYVRPLVGNSFGIREVLSPFEPYNGCDVLHITPMY